MKNRIRKCIQLLTITFISAMLGLGFCPGGNVMAANTLFMHPDFSMDPVPDTMYYSNYTNVQIYKESYGICANIDNLAGIGTALQEVSDHVNEKSGKHFCIGVVTNGADYTAADINLIVQDGWTKVESYYYDYEITVKPVATQEGFAPRISKAESPAIQSLLEQAGYDQQVALIQMSGINQPFFGMSYYQKDFSFLKGGNVYGYKYVEQTGCFVQVEKVYYNSWGKNIVEMYDVQKTDGSANGLFLVTKVKLPQELVATSDTWETYVSPYTVSADDPSGTDAQDEDTTAASDAQDVNPADNSDLQDNDVTSDSDESNDQTMTEESAVPSDNPIGGQTTGILSDTLSADDIRTYQSQGEPLMVQSEDGLLEWKIENIERCVDFRTSGKIEQVNETDLHVDFAHSGDLPGKALVSLSLASYGMDYEDGQELYLYYKNPNTLQYELSSTGTYMSGRATFSLTHCSEYLLTSVSRGDAFSYAAKKTSFTVFCIVLGSILLVSGISIGVIRKRKKKGSQN